MADRSALTDLLQSDDAVSEMLERLHRDDPTSAIRQFADSNNVTVDIAVWLAFATSHFLCIQMVDGAHGASNRLVDNRNNSLLEGITPPMDLIALAYEIQANEIQRVSTFGTDREFRRLALLEHLLPSDTASSSNSVYVGDLEIGDARETSRMTANGRALQELKKLCSGRSSLVWMICVLGIGVFIFVHSEFSGDTGFKWLFDNA